MFGIVHGIVFLLSALLWMVLAAWNTRAAAWGMSAGAIGLLNFWAYAVYIASALTLGHLGDRRGYKRPLAVALLLFGLALPTGLLWKAPGWLYLTAMLTTLFYGFFYPSVEGLLSRMEAQEGADPASTTARFSLSWSSGNIFGMVSGPGLVQSRPEWIFLGGGLLCAGAAALLWNHHRRHGDRLPGRYPAGGTRGADSRELPLLRRRRLAARTALFCATSAFFGTLFLFPKILWTAGVPAVRIGLLAAAGNLAVFALFASFARTRFWIGRDGVTTALSAGALFLFAGAFLLPPVWWAFMLLAALGGVAYALPYTFAIYYGLNTPGSDHGMQGAIHETLIGLGQGGGPLLAGLLLGAVGDWRVLGLLATSLGILSLAVQVVVLRSPRRSAAG